MRRLLFLILPMIAFIPAAAQVVPSTPFGAAPYRPLTPAPYTPPRYSSAPFNPAPFNPAADYVTAGQDEPGYQAWYKAATWRPVYVRAFHNYLVTNGVSGVAPTWQLLRTATDWQRCGADPFEVPPTDEWANIVATLRFIRNNIVPVIGPVEPVSVYRNPALNACAGGAQTSTHREMGAVDIVPLRPISRESLMVQLCAIHTAHPDSNNGLGFYKGLRFHIDARKYREWGTTGARGGFGCGAVLAEGAAPFAGAGARRLAEPLVLSSPSPIPNPRRLSPPLVTAPSPDAMAPTDRLAPLGQ
jgi:hypothetical protein